MSRIYINVNNANADFSEMERNLRAKYGLDVEVHNGFKQGQGIRNLEYVVDCYVAVDIFAQSETCLIEVFVFDPTEHQFKKSTIRQDVNLENVSDEIADAVKASGITRKYVLR